MTYSIINSKNLEGSTRLDPQFYQLKFIKNRNKIKSIPNTVSFQKIADIFTKGIFNINADNYVERGIPFVRVSNLRNGFVEESNIVFIPKSIHDQNSKTILNKGDIILSKTAYPAAALVNMEECNISQDTIGIKINSKYIKTVKPSFIVSFLNAKHGYLLMQQWFQGNVQTHLALSDAKTILIPILDASIQKKIDKFFWKSNDYSTKAKYFFNDAVKIIEQEIQLESIFNKKICYVQNSDEIIQSKRYDAEYFQPLYFQLKENIKNYKYGYSKLKDICDNQNKKINPKKDFSSKEFDYVELNGINLFLGIIEKTEKVFGRDAPSRAKMKLQKNDIVASSVEGSIGRVALINTDQKNLLGSTGFFVFRTKSLPSEYLLALIKSRVLGLQIKREATGSILASTNSESLENIIVPNIPKEKRVRIAVLVKKAHEYYEKSKQLFSISVNAMDLALDKNEQTSINFLNKVPSFDTQSQIPTVNRKKIF